ncbi:hypothetical protein [Oryza sativa Japonica Group]|uniref:Uncharacterized protein n=1 Tax=Oryza sativa subsp. japonica TaxID=39947 RepID=Q941T2_ORYSJ|nr:hypothetical protein [Oryza sativa Japonica Group]
MRAHACTDCLSGRGAQIVQRSMHMHGWEEVADFNYCCNPDIYGWSMLSAGSQRKELHSLLDGGRTTAGGKWQAVEAPPPRPPAETTERMERGHRQAAFLIGGWKGDTTSGGCGFRQRVAEVSLVVYLGGGDSSSLIGAMGTAAKNSCIDVVILLIMALALSAQLAPVRPDRNHSTGCCFLLLPDA